MAAGIASGIWEPPNCWLAVPAWPPSLDMELLGVSPKKGVGELVLGVCIALGVVFPSLGLQAAT